MSRVSNNELASQLGNLPLPPRRKADSHKGSYGRVLVVAGRRGMSGAAVLAGSAAVRSGAGLVLVASPAEIQGIVALGNPCYMTAAISHHADGTYSAQSLDEVLTLAQMCTVVAIGPGMGRSKDVVELVRGLVESLPDHPLVLDADALTCLAPFPKNLAPRTKPLVLTPHHGEFARLLGIREEEVASERQRLAIEFATQHNVTLLLKGHRSIITDGRRQTTNRTGNPGMATGGTGDVLTGVIAALMAQGMGAYEAASLGAWVHGRAGDLAAAELSQIAMNANDVVNYLPAAFKAVEAATGV